ncbi:MAG: amidohydrolase [Burkholderiales bacterium]|nr:MAG: amidohydrolase [Burkholderiales bacterium]
MTPSPFDPELFARLVEIRRDLHRHPELAFAERRTAERVGTALDELGIAHRRVAQTGVVAELPGPEGIGVVALRADLDALPVTEETGLPFASVHEGVMHACGHDGHTAMLLGAARHLADSRNFDGVVNFIFQPAEEGQGGALAMIEDRLFERFPCQAIFGMHNRPSLPVGRFAVRAGPMMAGGAFFDIDITGRGAHGARPETGVDPIMVASHVAGLLQTIVSRNVSPVDTAVLSVTQFHAGDAYNVIPQTARLSGTVRAFSRELMHLVRDNMTRIAQGVAAGMGAQATVDFRINFAPTVNDPAEAEFAAAICAELVGEAHVERDPPLIMASEDFSFMLEQVPGCYLNLGNGPASGEEGIGGCEVHNPAYDFNDAALPYGAAFFVRLVEKRLAPH